MLNFRWVCSTARMRRSFYDLMTRDRNAPLETNVGISDSIELATTELSKSERALAIVMPKRR